MLIGDAYNVLKKTAYNWQFVFKHFYNQCLVFGHKSLASVQTPFQPFNNPSTLVLKEHRAANVDLHQFAMFNSNLQTFTHHRKTSRLHQPLKAQSLNAQPLNAQPLNAQPLNAQPLKAQPLNARPLKAQPLAFGTLPLH